MAAPHEAGDQCGPLGVADVVIVLDTDVVECDVGSAAGDLLGSAGGDGVRAVETGDDDAVGRQVLVQGDAEVVEGVAAVADGERDAGVPGGPGRAAQQALVGRGHAPGGRCGGDQAGGAASLHARDDHAFGDLPGEEVRELLGRPGRRRVGLRREEVAAEQRLRPLSRRRDDVHAGRAGEGFVQPDVPAVEHPGAVDDRAAAVGPEVRQLRGEDLEDLRAVDGDVEGVLRARNHRQQGLMDRDDAQILGRHRSQDGVHGVGLDAHACPHMYGWVRCTWWLPSP